MHSSSFKRLLASAIQRDEPQESLIAAFQRSLSGNVSRISDPDADIVKGNIRVSAVTCSHSYTATSGDRGECEALLEDAIDIDCGRTRCQVEYDSHFVPGSGRNIHNLLGMIRTTRVRPA